MLGFNKTHLGKIALFNARKGKLMGVISHIDNNTIIVTNLTNSKLQKQSGRLGGGTLKVNKNDVTMILDLDN